MRWVWARRRRQLFSSIHFSEPITWPLPSWWYMNSSSRSMALGGSIVNHSPLGERNPTMDGPPCCGPAWKQCFSYSIKEVRMDNRTRQFWHPSDNLWNCAHRSRTTGFHWVDRSHCWWSSSSQRQEVQAFRDVTLDEIWMQSSIDRYPPPGMLFLSLYWFFRTTPRSSLLYSTFYSLKPSQSSMNIWNFMVIWRYALRRTMSPLGCQAPWQPP